MLNRLVLPAPRNIQLKNEKKYILERNKQKIVEHVRRLNGCYNP